MRRDSCRACAGSFPNLTLLARLPESGTQTVYDHCVWALPTHDHGRRWTIRSGPNGSGEFLICDWVWPKRRYLHFQSCVLIDQFAENQNVTVRVLHFKFPIAVRLFAQRHLNVNLVPDRLVKFIHALHSNIGVPNATYAGCNRQAFDNLRSAET